MTESQPAYRLAERTPGEWVVVAGPPQKPGPAVLVGFKTERAALSAAEILNDAAHATGRDDVLRQMLGTPRKSKGP